MHRSLNPPLALSMLAIAAALPASRAAEPAAGFKVPPGFEVTEFAGDKLAHDIYSMTIDSQGRVVVSGPGYIRTLLDADGDGRADSAEDFVGSLKSGAHGMLFDGVHLYCTGDDGLWQFLDRDGDGKADRYPVLCTILGDREHGAHGLARGPDGAIYLVCGNHTWNEQTLPLKATTLRIPNTGAIFRFLAGNLHAMPDQATVPVDWQFVATGFRNPYDLVFHPNGLCFTVDSDGEREHHLPWYTPTRLFDVTTGMDHGWLPVARSRSWSTPAYFADVAPRSAEFGRGSPTGLEVYACHRFPKRYRNGVFSACWTFGRVYFCPFEDDGSSVKSTPETFLETTGNVGFAPVDLAVDPAGDLYVAIGGRGTQGGVFRIRYTGPIEEWQPPEDPIRAMLQAEQPYSAWSRARHAKTRASLTGMKLAEIILDDQNYTLEERLRAIEIAAENQLSIWPRTNDEVVKLKAIQDPRLIVKLAWMFGVHNRRAFFRKWLCGEVLAAWTKSRDPRVLRATWETIATGIAGDPAKLDFKPAAESRDPRVRMAMIRAARGPVAGAYAAAKQDGLLLDRDPALANMLDLWIRVAPAPEALHIEAPGPVERLLADIRRGFRTNDDAPIDHDRRSQAIRLLQVLQGDIGLAGKGGEVQSGYAAQMDWHDSAMSDGIQEELVPIFPTGHRTVDLELSRLFAMIETDAPAALEKTSLRWTETSLPQDDIHYLIVASRLAAPRDAEFTARTARALARLHAKYAALGLQPSDNFPLRIAELFRLLQARDTALAAAIVNEPDFGQLEHLIFAQEIPAASRRRAAEKLLATAQRAEALGDSPWTVALFDLVKDVLPETAIPSLRAAWSDPTMRDPIALFLAAKRDPLDRERLIEALGSKQPEVVVRAAEALSTYPGRDRASDFAAVLRALRGPSELGKLDIQHTALLRLLDAWSPDDGPHELARGGLKETIAAWKIWYAKRYPNDLQRLTELGDLDAAAWRIRLAKINWPAGDLERGKLVFEKKACQRCHTGTSRLGPDLAGTAVRFSRDDLFAAILFPSAQISPAYKMLSVTTRDGRIVSGLPVYVSPDGVLLATGPDVTVRLKGEEIESQAASPLSLMPNGLLDDLSDQELADLYAYLQEVGAVRRP